MLLLCDKEKQKRFNRCSYRTDPDWERRKYGRMFWIFAAILTPCVVLPVAWLRSQGAFYAEMVICLLTAALLPELVLLPIAVLRCKSDRRASTPECAGRYGDALLFSHNQLVYTYCSTENDITAKQYECLIPYASIGRVVLVPKRQILLILAGGMDSCSTKNGTLLRRIDYAPGGGAAPMRWVEIPLVYPDNSLLLQQLQKNSSIAVEVSDRSDLNLD